MITRPTIIEDYVTTKGWRRYSLPVNIGDCSNIELDEIEIGLITRAAFLELLQWITQRSVTNRIKKKGVLDHLAKTIPYALYCSVSRTYRR